MHWHIDYLLQYAEIKNVYYKESIFREECNITKKFAGILISVPGFGSSDCRCKSHLFYGELTQIRDLLKQINMNNYSFNANT